MNELVESPFGTSEPSGELVETASARQLQSRELAETQTKYLMAQQFPRDERKAMDGIINAFSRSGLAERSQYQYSRGGTDIAGPSIHASQAIAQQWGNVEMGWRELSRGIDAKGIPFSEVEAYAIDLQARVPSRITFIVKHWRDTKQGGYKLKDERDIYELCANQAQRRKRACILSVLPQDVIDTAMSQATVTLNAKADNSPAAMAKMLEAFAAFDITKEQIEKRIQRRIDTITPAQVVSLKRIYASIRDDMSEPGDWFDVPKEEPKAEGLEAVRRAATEKKAKTAPPPPAEPEKPKANALEQYKAIVDKAANNDDAMLALDMARGELNPIEQEELAAHYRSKWVKA